MSDSNWFDKLLMGIVIVSVIALVVLFASLPVAFYAQNACLMENYPRNYVQIFPFEIKCGITVNQTEYICTLEEIRAGDCFEP